MFRQPLVVGVAAVTAMLAGCGGDDASDEERDRAIAGAERAYEKAVAQGELHFDLFGERLRGRFAIIRRGDD